jgi:hypothetical protein
MNLETLNKKVEALEKTMLAIDELSGICQQAICHGNQPIDLDRCVNVLNYLIEPAMFQVEAVRMQLDAMIQQAEQSTTVRSLKCS